MTELYLIRHGRTAWNKNRIFRGGIDVPLDEVGRAEAAALAEWAVGVNIDHIYSSPLSRAVETAAVISRKTGLDVNTLEDLRDINYGRWQGMSEKEVKEKYSAMHELWNTAPQKVMFPDGENLASVKARCFNCVQRLHKKHPDETLALVSHRVVLKVLCLALLGLPDSHFRRIQQDTCCVDHFRLEGREATVMLLNDICHLKGIQRETAGEDF